MKIFEERRETIYRGNWGEDRGGGGEGKILGTKASGGKGEKGSQPGKGERRSQGGKGGKGSRGKRS